MPQALLKITGEVQGVSFRFHAKKEADSLDLTGYAKNLSDGSVEILIQGPRQKLDVFIGWCHGGSPSATVEGIDVKWSDPPVLEKSFSVF